MCFSLWVEILLVPMFAIIGGMVAIAESDPKFSAVHKLLSRFMVIVGLAVTTYALYKLFLDFKQFVTPATLESFSLPVILTVLFLPFVYLFALYASYEMLFLRMGFFIKDKSLLKYAKRKTLHAFALDAHSLNEWANHIVQLSFEDRQSVDQAIHKFKSEVAY